MNRNMVGILIVMIVAIAAPFVLQADRVDSCSCGKLYKFRTQWAPPVIMPLGFCGEKARAMPCTNKTKLLSPLGAYVNLI